MHLWRDVRNVGARQVIKQRTKIASNDVLSIEVSYVTKADGDYSSSSRSEMTSFIGGSRDFAWARERPNRRLSFSQRVSDQREKGGRRKWGGASVANWQCLNGGHCVARLFCTVRDQRDLALSPADLACAAGGPRPMGGRAGSRNDGSRRHQKRSSDLRGRQQLMQLTACIASARICSTETHTHARTHTHTHTHTHQTRRSEFWRRCSPRRTPNCAVRSTIIFNLNVLQPVQYCIRCSFCRLHVHCKVYGDSSSIMYLFW